MSRDEVAGQLEPDRFPPVWRAAGTMAFVVSLGISWMIWMTFDQPTHCGYHAPCSTAAVIERALLPWSIAWTGWFLAGWLTWFLGTSTRKHPRNPIGALISGSLLFAAAIAITGFALVSAINATHGP